MIVHKYKNLKRRRRTVVTYCGKEFAMVLKQSRFGMGSPKIVPPVNCLATEAKLSCAVCIDALIGVYQKRINVLEKLPVESEEMPRD